MDKGEIILGLYQAGRGNPIDDMKVMLPFLLSPYRLKLG